MDYFNYSFDYDGQNLLLFQGTLEYLAGINPKKEWAERGFKATGFHKNEMEDLQETIKSEIKIYIENDAPGMESFLDEALALYEALRDGVYQVARDKIEDSEIYIITGPPRTGGTYLLKAMMEIRNNDLTAFNHKMMFDYVPLHTQMGEEMGATMTSQAVFGWVQWLLWASKTFDFSEFQFLPKKHIGVLFQLELFEQIFGDRITYVITTRDPGEAYLSYAERFFPEGKMSDDFDVGLWKNAVLPRTNLDEETWNELELPDKFLLYWCACYLEVLNYGNLEHLNVLTFGNDYNQFLQKFAQDRGKLYFPEEFDPTPREERPEFSDHCLEMKGKVEARWEETFDKPLSNN
jgi:hypothetical protein